MQRDEEEMVVQYRPSDLRRLPLADRLKVTHCELHPSMIFSTSDPDRNQALRMILFSRYQGRLEEIPRLKVCTAEGGARCVQCVLPGDEPGGVCGPGYRAIL